MKHVSPLSCSIVIQLSSDSISAAQANELARLLSEGSGAFTLKIVEVTVSDDDDGVLSGPVIIGIAVGAGVIGLILIILLLACLLYTSPSPRDATLSRMPSSA